MAFIELTTSSPKYAEYRDLFLKAKKLGEEESLRPADNERLEYPVYLSGRSFAFVHPADVVRYKQELAEEEPDRQLAAGYSIGVHCLRSPKPPAGHKEWNTCFSRSRKNNVFQNSLRIYQNATDLNDSRYAPDIIELTGVFAKNSPRLSMVVGDVDGDGLYDIALFGSDGSARIYLGDGNLPQPAQRPNKEVDLFNTVSSKP